MGYWYWDLQTLNHYQQNPIILWQAVLHDVLFCSPCNDYNNTNNYKTNINADQHIILYLWWICLAKFEASMQPNCTARSLMVNSFFFPNRHSIVLKAWMYAFLVIPERRIATFYDQEDQGEFTIIHHRWISERKNKRILNLNGINDTNGNDCILKIVSGSTLFKGWWMVPIDTNYRS